MTYTYGQNPGTTTPSRRKDSVRWLVGDTDDSDPQVQDEEIEFALGEAGDNVYRAAAITARAIAGKYSRLVDTTVDETGLRARYDQRQKSYHDLAAKLEEQSKKYGSSAGLGVPAAGGISRDDVESARTDADRVKPVFRVTNDPEIDVDADQI